jgi:hypothetical protein
MDSNSAWLTVGCPHLGQLARGEERSTVISPEISALLINFSNIKPFTGHILTHFPHPLQDLPEWSKTVSPESS